MTSCWRHSFHAVKHLQPQQVWESEMPIGNNCFGRSNIDARMHTAGRLLGLLSSSTPCKPLMSILRIHTWRLTLLLLMMICEHFSLRSQAIYNNWSTTSEMKWTREGWVRRLCVSTHCPPLIHRSWWCHRHTWIIRFVDRACFSWNAISARGLLLLLL